jgi:hypothetical protein
MRQREGIAVQQVVHVVPVQPNGLDPVAP